MNEHKNGSVWWPSGEVKRRVCAAGPGGAGKRVFRNVLHSSRDSPGVVIEGEGEGRLLTALHIRAGLSDD